MQGSVRRFALAVGAVAVATACGGVAATAAAAATAPPLTERTPVARVGDATITYGTLRRWADSDLADDGSSMRIALSIIVPPRFMLLEAERLGIAVPARPEGYEDVSRYAREFGLRRSDLAVMLRGLAAQQLLVAAWESSIPAPSEPRLLRAWRRQRGPGFFTPRQRRAELLELPTRAVADQALAALRAGESFAAVGARLAPQRESAFRGDVQLFSDAPIQPTTPEEFFAEPDVPVRQLPQPLERALYGAPVGELRGPIVTSRAVFVLRVTEIVSQRARRPLAQVRALLEPRLRARQLERLTTVRTRQLNRRWRARTTCDRRIAVRSLCGRVVTRVRR